MSTWYEAKPENIDIEDGEVDILVTNDDLGNIYLTLTFEQIKEIYKKIMSIQPGR